MKNPDLITQIVKSVSGAIHKPLTVKVRIGFEKEPVDIVEIAKRIEDAGQLPLQYMEEPGSSIILARQTGRP